jgi:hypothetical protein
MKELTDSNLLEAGCKESFQILKRESDLYCEVLFKEPTRKNKNITIFLEKFNELIY